MPEENETLLSQTQLAARLGVSERTIQRLVRRGILPSVRVGNTPVFRLGEIQKAMSRQETHTEPHDGPDRSPGKV